MFVRDGLADLLKLAIYAVGSGVFVYSREYLRARGLDRGEYFVLGLFGVLGMMVMVSAGHFLTLYLGLELLSLSLYAMIAFQRDSATATEAAMKYFVLGALASGMLLYGMSMLYGMTGSLEIGAVRRALTPALAGQVALAFGLVFVIVGIAFKLGAVPFHMWIPDVYHGAPTAVTLYIASIPKLAAFALVMRLLVGGLQELLPSWQTMLMILALLSMGAGNVIAIAQSNIKRMLAYSAIAHTGFLLLGVLAGGANGYGSALFYVLVYAAMSLGAFGLLVLLSRAGFEAERVDDLKGLNHHHPWHALLMLVIMFSMAGIPPTAGFYAKLSVIQAVVDIGAVWLAAAAVLFSVIGAYYYLRVVKVMYFDAPQERLPLARGAAVHALISANALGLLVVTPWVGTLLQLCHQAVRSAA
jgi:NADH-quinone oxidoreductase subunit N